MNSASTSFFVSHHKRPSRVLNPIDNVQSEPSNDSSRSGLPPISDSTSATATSEGLNQNYNFRSCLDNTESLNVTAGGIIDVDFLYDVESTRSLTKEEEISMLDALEYAMVESMFEAECNSRRRLVRRRRMELIHTVSVGNRDQIQGKCTITTDAATSCSRYDGSIKIGYITPEEGDSSIEYQAGDAVLSTVKTDLIHDNYLDEVNLALARKATIDGTQNISFITRISYVGSNHFNNTEQKGGVMMGMKAETSTTDEVGRGGLSFLGRSFVPIAGLLLIGAIIALFLARRHRKRHQQQLIDRIVRRVNYDNQYLERPPNDDPFQKEDLLHRPDRHSKRQDVHRCNNIHCVACNQQRQNIFLRLRDGSSDDPPGPLLGFPIPAFYGGSRSSQPSLQLRNFVDEEDDDHGGWNIIDEDKFENEPPGVKFVPVYHKPFRHSLPQRSLVDDDDDDESNNNNNRRTTSFFRIV